MGDVARTFVALIALGQLTSSASAKPGPHATRQEPQLALSLARSELSIDGTLDQGQLRLLLGPYELALEDCLGKADVKAPRPGRAVLQFAIGDHGGVLTALVRDSEIQHRLIEQCIADQARDWTFALKLTEPVLVTVPIVVALEKPEGKRRQAPRDHSPASLFGRDSALGAAATAAIAGMDGSEVPEAYGLGEIVKLGRSSKHPQSGPVPEVRTVAMTTSSGLENEEVRHMIQLRLNELRFCYELGRAKDARLAGSMTVQYVITPRGKSTDVRMVSTTLRDKPLQQCVLATLQRWTYPRPTYTSETPVALDLTFFLRAAP